MLEIVEALHPEAREQLCAKGPGVGFDAADQEDQEMEGSQRQRSAVQALMDVPGALALLAQSFAFLAPAVL